MPDSQPQTNIDSNLWASAMRSYEEDRGAVDRAQGRLRKNQLAYDKQGVPAAAIRARYKERNMSRDERQQLYAEEIVSRRALALTLWDADSEEDFDRLMERATAVKPADDVELENIEGARAYNDGYNSGTHGSDPTKDNPHVYGTALHERWALGCADGIGERPREAPQMQAATDSNGGEVSGNAGTPGPAPKKARGRPPGSPNRKTPSQLLDENAAKLNGDQPAEDADDPPLKLFDDEDMPEVAEIPE